MCFLLFHSQSISVFLIVSHNLYRPVERYIARRIGVVMYRQVRFCYCPVEGDVGIEQYRNGLGIVCCKWRWKILSFKFTEEILV